MRDMKNTAEKIWNSITTFLVILAVLLAILLAGVRVVGLPAYVVMSGSMEPVYPMGSLLYVQDADPEEIKTGDAITFVLNEELTVATHQVIEIDEENRCFYTKGDANEAADGAPVYYENLLGRPVFCIPHLGYIAAFIQHPPGTYIAAACGAAILLMLFLPDLLREEEPEGKKRPRQRKRRTGRKK